MMWLRCCKMCRRSTSKVGALILRRRQIGTVVMDYPDGAFEIEFADRDGRAFAILSLRPEQLMLLRDTPDFAAA